MFQLGVEGQCQGDWQQRRMAAPPHAPSSVVRVLRVCFHLGKPLHEVSSRPMLLCPPQVVGEAVQEKSGQLCE